MVQDLVPAAHERLGDAQAALTSGSPTGSVYLAGYSVEMVLKHAAFRAEGLQPYAYVRDALAPARGRLNVWLGPSITTAITASSSGPCCCGRLIGTDAARCRATCRSRFERRAGCMNAGRWHFATDLPWFRCRTPSRFFARPDDFQPGPMSFGGSDACSYKECLRPKSQ